MSIGAPVVRNAILLPCFSKIVRRQLPQPLRRRLTGFVEGAPEHAFQVAGRNAARYQQFVLAGLTIVKVGAARGEPGANVAPAADGHRLTSRRNLGANARRRGHEMQVGMIHRLAGDAVFEYEGRAIALGEKRLSLRDKVEELRLPVRGDRAHAREMLTRDEAQHVPIADGVPIGQ